MSKKTIVVVGAATMDLFYLVPKIPGKEESVEVDNYTLTAGGKALTIATGLKRYEENVVLIASIGKDKFGEEIQETFLIDGFDTNSLIIQENFPTDITTVVVTPDARPTYIASTSANYHLSIHDVEKQFQLLNDIDGIIVTTTNPEVMRWVLEYARKNKILNFVKPSPPETYIKGLFSLTDFLILNEWELSEMSSKSSTEELVRDMINKGVKNVILTKGIEKALFGNNETIKEYKSLFPVKPTDITGATSAFTALFVSKILETKSIGTAIKFGLAAGTLVAGRHGSRQTLPFKKEIDTLVESV